MTPRLLIGTNNAHKVREMVRLLDGAGWDALTPREHGIALEVVEDGATFEENALIKARAFAAASGLPTLADDSGIEVDALGGRPGVHSARYGGPGLSDEERTALLLDEMAAVPDGRRGCRFVAVLALVWPAGGAETFGGTCEGEVARAPAGDGGFGYDPVFYVPSAARTVAQMDAAQKDAFSHRGKAARLARERLATAAAEGAPA